MNLDPNDPTQAAVAELTNNNLARCNTLHAQGIQVQIPGREQHLLERILDIIEGTTPERIEFEKQWQLALANVLDQAEAQVRAHRLTQGITLDHPAHPRGLA